MEFARIPPGTFLMGSALNDPGRKEDEAQHEVEITRPFYMGVHEVTQEQFERVMALNPSLFSATGKAMQEKRRRENLDAFKRINSG
jgi:formylglycine-generating enzyme required for sulfatase activity